MWLSVYALFRNDIVSTFGRCLIVGFWNHFDHPDLFCQASFFTSSNSSCEAFADDSGVGEIVCLSILIRFIHYVGIVNYAHSVE